MTKRKSRKDKAIGLKEQPDERVETRPLAEPTEAGAVEADRRAEAQGPATQETEAAVVEPSAQAAEPSAQAAEPTEGESVEALRAEMASLKAQSDEYLDGWQRARAEFANYKKRVEREMEQSYAATAAQILARYLPILDDIERALRERPTENEVQAWTEGIELIHRKLTALLEAEGVERIPAESQRFDPNLHEAISFEEKDGHEEGQIIDVIRQGYRLGERILRPAVVRVAR